MIHLFLLLSNMDNLINTNTELTIAIFFIQHLTSCVNYTCVLNTHICINITHVCNTAGSVPHTSRVLDLILNSGYCMCRVVYNLLGSSYCDLDHNEQLFITELNIVTKFKNPSGVLYFLLWHVSALPADCD